MRIITNLIRKCYLIAALLLPTCLFGQSASECFKARLQTPEKKAMNVKLTSSDTIPLNNLGIIYALSIDAVIEQPREASFVRIVLEDVEGKNYLVAESDRFRNDTTTVQLTEYCEETALLSGITPLRLKCYLTNATLQLTGIHASTEMPKRGNPTSSEMRSVKETQVKDIVDRINAYNVRHGKLWQAAAMPYSLKTAEEQGSLFQEDAYLANMKYYAGGLYEIGERRRQASAYNSPYADSFDWSETRHGKQWITSVKDQVVHGPCHVFAAVGVAEALTNLYFNDTINLDLSEQFIMTYTDYFPTGNWSTYTLDVPITFIATDSVIDESSAVYGEPLSSTGQRPVGLESIKFTDIVEISSTGLSFDAFSDSIKKHLIHDGPGVWGCEFPNNPNSYSHHYMALVGYGTTRLGQHHYIITSSSNELMTIDASMAGKTFWKFKNSYGSSAATYMTIVFNDDATLYPVYFAKTPIIRRGHSDSDIICEDRDGDGYFNWGISETPPVTLPEWAFGEKDADDTDAYVGALYENGEFEDVDFESGKRYITSIDTISSPTFNRKEIVIRSGGKLIVMSDFRCLPTCELKIESGGTLEIQGGSVVNVNFQMESGATLKISNNGLLMPIIDDENMFFNIPVGAVMDISSGEIRKSEIEFYEY